MKYSAYGENFVHQLDTEELTRLGRLANEGLPADVAEAVIKHIDNFADYSDDTIRKIVESECNADRILTKIDEYGKDFTEDLTAGQLKRVDDILEQGITPEQFEVLLDHADNLENYTDEIVELWRNYGGDSEEFLKLVDEFGAEFVEAFEADDDEAVEKFRELLEKETDLDIEIRNIIENVPNEYKTIGRCDSFAKSLIEQLKQNNIEYEIIRVDSNYSIYSDKAGEVIGIDYLYGIKIGNMIYDNMTPSGMNFELWLEDLGLTSQPKEVITWSIVEEI